MLHPQPKPKPKLLTKWAAKASKATDYRKVRAIVLNRDGHRCRACSHPHGLDVHHVTMRSLGGKDEVENLISLCRDCHAAVHGHVLILHGSSARSVRMEWVR